MTTRSDILAHIARIKSATTIDDAEQAYNDAYYAARLAYDGGELAADKELHAERERAIDAAYARLQAVQS